MEKRGISKIIAGVLLILVSISAVFILYQYIKSSAGSLEAEGSEKLACLTEVNLEIISACHASEKIFFVVENKGRFDYETEFFKLNIKRDGGSFEAPTISYSLFKSLEQKKFSVNVEKPDEIEEVSFIPKIKQDKGYCYGQALKFNVGDEC